MSSKFPLILFLTLALASCSTSAVTSSQVSLPNYTKIEPIKQADRISADSKYLFVKDLPEAKALVVLVHGWSGDQSTTWGALPEILAGGYGDTATLLWTRGINTLLYGYPTMFGGRELERQARIFNSEIGLARRLCDCRHIYLVGHSMGALVITRALVTLLLTDAHDTEEGSSLDSLASVVLLAPAFQLTAKFDSLVASWGWGQLNEMREFSRFRETLNADILRLRRNFPDRYAKVFIQRTAFILAEDDIVVNNSAVRSQFVDSKTFDLPGGHEGVVKVDTPNNETFRVLARLLQSTSPIQLVQLPSKIDARISLDDIEIRQEEVFLGADSIIAKIVLTTADRSKVDDVEVAVSPAALGFFAEVFKKIEYRPRGREWIVRVIREPTAQSEAEPHELLIFVNGRLSKRLPIIAKSSNRAVYEKIVQENMPIVRGLRGERQTVQGWTPARISTADLVQQLAKSGVEERVLVGEALAVAFLDYVAGDKHLLSLAFIPRDQINSAKRSPMLLKWLGVEAVVSGRLAEGYEYFRQLSQVEPIGELYGALVLAQLGRIDEARAIFNATPQSLRGDPGVLEDCVRLFGQATVELVLGNAKRGDE